MLCQHCMVTTHWISPLHSIRVKFSILFSSSGRLTDIFQEWTGEFFTEIGLRDLGATYQLGHFGDRCPMPSSATDLTLFDITGVTTVRIHYCYCGKPGQQLLPRTQLLRMAWFPATLKQPGTAFTFRFLDYLHDLQTRSKGNLYDIYETMASAPNPAGLKPRIVSTRPSPTARTTDTTIVSLQ